MEYITTMTQKQQAALVLFAQNFSFRVIAEKEEVCLQTIRNRIMVIIKRYPKEFANALALRNVYKRNRDAIRAMSDFQSHRRRNDEGEDRDFEEFISEGYNGVKQIF